MLTCYTVDLCLQGPFIYFVCYYTTIYEIKVGEGYTGVSRRSIGLLVKCCVSNSSHSFQVIYMKLATHYLYDMLKCMP